MLTRLTNWFLCKIDPDHKVLNDWAYADTNVSTVRKLKFIDTLALVGGIVGQHHPWFDEMQKDYLAYKGRQG